MRLLELTQLLPSNVPALRLSCSTPMPANPSASQILNASSQGNCLLLAVAQPQEDSRPGQTRPGPSSGQMAATNPLSGVAAQAGVGAHPAPAQLGSLGGLPMPMLNHLRHACTMLAEEELAPVLIGPATARVLCLCAYLHA